MSVGGGGLGTTWHKVLKATEKAPDRPVQPAAVSVEHLKAEEMLMRCSCGFLGVPGSAESHGREWGLLQSPSPEGC